MKCNKGDWVQIRTTVLPAGQRAPQVPPETQAVPLIMFSKGYASQSAEIGQTITITTVIGQILEGELTAINPHYGHDFGEPVPELMHIGVSLRKRLEKQP